MFVCIYIHTHTYIHTQTQTYIHKHRMQTDFGRTLRSWYTVEFVLTTTFCPSKPTGPGPIFRHRSSPSSSRPCFRISTWGSSASNRISDSRRKARSRRMHRHTRFSKQTALSWALDNASTACVCVFKNFRNAEQKHAWNKVGNVT
jgi:hypothetical protein